jgi:hypothetical protein
MQWINGLLNAHIGLPHVAFWSLMIGGNIIGLVLSIPAYPFFKRIITRLAAEKNTSKLRDKRKNGTSL